MGRICIFGDSITYGSCDLEKGGWVSRLRNYCDNNFDELRVYNAGISADNSNDLVKRFDVECKSRKPKEGESYVIIIAIGINDSQYLHKNKDNPRISLDKFEKNLISLINLAKKYTNKIIFIGLTKIDETKTAPVPWNTIKSYDNENIQKYDLIIKKITEQNNLLFIDMFGLLDKKNDLEDGLHPNSQGHKKMFERIKHFLIDNNILK